VDTPEDFMLIEKIYEQLYRTGEVFELKNVIKFLRGNPELFEINKHIIQMG
jgi:spore coat polysaccharide biosynthesis protein SpsF